MWKRALTAGLRCPGCSTCASQLAKSNRMTRRLRSGSREATLHLVEIVRQIDGQLHLTQTIGPLLLDLFARGNDTPVQKSHEVQILDLECECIPLGLGAALDDLLQGTSNLGDRGSGISRPSREMFMQYGEPESDARRDPPAALAAGRGPPCGGRRDSSPRRRPCRPFLRAARLP